MKKFIIENVQRLCTNIPSSMWPGSYHTPWDFDEELDTPCRTEWMMGNDSHEITLFSDKMLKYEIIQFKMLPNGIATRQSIFHGQCTLTTKEYRYLSNKLIDLLDQYFNHIAESYRIV